MSEVQKFQEVDHKEAIKCIFHCSNPGSVDADLIFVRKACDRTIHSCLCLEFMFMSMPSFLQFNERWPGDLKLVLL